MKDEDVHTMENQPVEVLQLAFKSRRLLLFSNKSGKPVNIGDMVVVSVDRGEDMGRVAAKLPPCESNIDRVEGNFLRNSTDADMDKFIANREFEKEVLEYCAVRVKVRSLDMRLTDCESQLDRNRIRIFFTADQRTDFRGLVRDMASAFRARIEMRQIGVRDDAKYKDGVGICGRQLCCAGFLNEFKSVTLKSVRDQHLSPNPSKVSGACSRLMCCLEYETDFYHKASRNYPATGAKFKVNGLQAKVKHVDIFKESVTLVWEGTGEEELLLIEDFHRRRTMTSPPPVKQRNPAGGFVAKQKVVLKTGLKPAGNSGVSGRESDANSAKKSEKKNRNRGRYWKKGNKREGRKN
jgi:cell fate regulator YaaT (PSP1 superfamily)